MIRALFRGISSFRGKLVLGSTIACAAVLGAFALSSSATGSIAVTGVVEGETVTTRLDHPQAAEYFLRHFSSESSDERMDTFDETLGESIPTAHQLRSLTRRYSTDLAALVLFRRLLKQARRESLYTRYRSELERIKKGNRVEGDYLESSMLFLFVPGWLYKSDPSTGADFAAIRKTLEENGAESILFNSAENGSVEQNAEGLKLLLARLANSGRRIVIVSGSKGGPETALALSSLRSSDVAKSVAAWVNAGGLLRGTALADEALTWPACWLVKLAVLPDGSFSGIRSLATDISARRFGKSGIPKHIKVINLIAVPMSGDVGSGVAEGYARLKHMEPNDGLTLLTDAIYPGGVTIPVFGSDHYFRDNEIGLKTLVLARVLQSEFQTE